jgi:hypothetical protein
LTVEKKARESGPFFLRGGIAGYDFVEHVA